MAMEKKELEIVGKAVYSDLGALKYIQRLHGLDCSVSELVGKTLTDIYVHKDGDNYIVFLCDDGTRYVMWHQQDCCENVGIDDICGDLDRLIGTPITKAEDVSNNMAEAYPSGDTEWGSQTWTFYHLATVKGYVTIRWLGESNGYYSESVEFTRVP